VFFCFICVCFFAFLRMFWCCFLDFFLAFILAFYYSTRSTLHAVGFVCLIAYYAPVLCVYVRLLTLYLSVQYVTINNCYVNRYAYTK